MPKIGCYARNDFRLGTAELVSDDNNHTIYAKDRKGQRFVLDIIHRHHNPAVDARREIKAKDQLALFNNVTVTQE